MEVKFTISMGLVGCRREEVLDFEEDMTDEELDEAWQDWRDEHVEGGWLRLAVPEESEG